jgi:recombination protein RecA
MPRRKKGEESEEDSSPDASMASKIVNKLSKDKNIGDVVKRASGSLISTTPYYVSTQAPFIDWVISQPGFPASKVTTVFGREGSGKSSICYHAIAEVQRMGGVAVLVDSEQRFTASRAQNDFGINLDELVVIEGATLEQAFAAIEDSIDVIRETDPNIPALIVYDSLAGSVPEKRLEADVGASIPALAARFVSGELPRLKLKIAKSGIALVIVNQLRSRVNFNSDPRKAMYAERQKVMGTDHSMLAEWPLLFESALMLYVQSVAAITDPDDKDLTIGIRSRVTNRKCGIGPGERRKAEFDLLHNGGIDRVTNLFEFLCKTGAIEGGGGWYNYDGEKFRSKNFADVLDLHPELWDIAREAVTAWQTGEGPIVGSDEDDDDD